MSDNGRVVLTQDEMEVAAFVGCKRRAESKVSNRKDTITTDPAKAWAVDIEGAAAEMAYCKFSDKFWSASVGTFKKPDQGERVQVRYSQRPNACLIVRELDPDDHCYVLVTGCAPEFFVRGWISGDEAKNFEFLRDPGGKLPAYFVPQSELKKFT